MGYERKRGKLAELNALLRGGARDALLARRRATPRVLPSVQVRDHARHRHAAAARRGAAARRRDGAPAEPRRASTPRSGASSRATASCSRAWRVSLPGANRSRYARLYGGEPGIDPYTRAVSDVYQDLFGEGSFIGKGIYDVDAFERALDGRFPENRILSHDLLEGCYARSGLLSDVQLYEDYPSTLQRRRAAAATAGSAATGRSRAGCCRACRAPAARRLAQSAVARCRSGRSSTTCGAASCPPALTLLLVLGWTVLPPAVVLDARGAGDPGHSCADARRCWSCCRKPPDVALAPAPARVALHRRRLRLLQTLFTLACLPVRGVRQPRRDRAHDVADAGHAPAAAANGRRRATSQRRRAHGLAGFVPRRCGSRPVHRRRRPRVLLARSAPAALAGRRAGPRRCGSPRPRIAWWLSRPLARREARLDARADRSSCASSRAGPGRSSRPSSAPDDHWLPPDNFQEHPVAVVAHRTSPTNIGSSLLANLAAYDFGYIPAGQLIERTAQRAATRCERWSATDGHFYNWYDTRTLEPLPPLYVSTVDSGNLAGHLLTLRPGLLALADAADRRPRAGSTASTTRCACCATRRGDAAAGRWRALRDDARVGLRCAARRRSRPRRGWLAPLDARAGRASRRSVAAAPDERGPTRGPTRCVRQCRDALDELELLAPWLALPAPRTLRAGSPASTHPDAARARRRCDATLPTSSAPTRRRRAARWLDDARAARRSGSRRAARAHRARSSACALQCDALARHGVRVPLRPSAPPARDRLQRRRAPARRRATTTCSPRRRGSRASSRIAQGQLPQENWFALGRLLTQRRRRAGAAVVERLDVRVPDAAAGDADLREHAARPDLPRGGGAADRVRHAARRAVGHVRVRLQHGRRAPQLPVPRVRRARPRASSAGWPRTW